MSDDMKVSVNRSALADAASWVSQVIGRNPGAAVLGGIKLVAAEGEIVLSGFDYDTSHVAHVAADVIASGEALISGRFFVQIVSAMKGNDVELVLEGSRLNVVAGRSTYRIGTMPVADYPTLPELPTHVGTIGRDRLVWAIATTEHAVSRDTSLRALTAFNVRGTSGELRLLATDRFRVARVVSKWADASGADFEVNVPATTLTASVKGLSGDLSLGCQGGLFGVSDSVRSITTRVLGEEEQFPQVDRLFDIPSAVSVEADGELMAEAVKRTLLVTEEHDLIGLEFSEGAVAIHADSDTAEGDEVLEVDGTVEMSLRFNGSYLLQAILASPAETIRFGLSAPNKQAQIQPVGDDSVALIVMPRRKQ